MEEIRQEVREIVEEMYKRYWKKYFLISYDSGLKDFNSNEFKEALTQLLLDEGAEDLQSPTESTIIFSNLHINKMSYLYWIDLIKESFKEEKYYEKNLFFILLEIKKEEVSDDPLYDGKENKELNKKYIERVETIRKL